ncbi:hypothetical protein G8E10_24790 [Rhizobiaceae bacterium CRRU44]|uniref:Uncharacterized protein n=1 Tax=Ferranicluibacter rubi TaxID=2715133 RepID=A0AA44CD40_9HYPH|nr:hypothetical protein [Ferranicluibacter rubi]NHT78920.1 hypothetical protein [Ferranicluibacter rubi]
MPADNTKDKGVISLDVMATTPNVKRNTLKEMIAESATYDLIRKAEKNKYTHAEIAVALKDKGIEIKPETLGLYLREIAREKGEDNAKQSAKPKANKQKPATASPQGSPSDTKRTEGKSLGKPLTTPAAFNDEV